jgi:hypothetical protein
MFSVDNLLNKLSLELQIDHKNNQKFSSGINDVINK